MKTLVSVALIALLAYGGVCATLFAFQRSLIYFPQPAGNEVAASTLRVAVDGADLAVAVRPHAGRHALVYFGGNAEDVSANLASFSEAFPDHAIYLMHYRGYGGSTGLPTEDSLHADAEALFDRVQPDHPEVAVLGRSLGSGVAIRLAARRPVSRLVLITPYDSLEEIAARQFSYVPVRWLLKDKFESWRHAPRITAPTFVLRAEFDEVIPRDSTERLHTAFPEGVASLDVIPGTSHNTIAGSPRYLHALQAALTPTSEDRP